MTRLRWPIIELSVLAAVFAGAVAITLSLPTNSYGAEGDDRAPDRRAARLQKKVAALKLESTEKSLERLCLMDNEWIFEQNEALMVGLPLQSHHGTHDIYFLMHLRRIRKVYEELAAMPKLRASMLIQEQLQVALKEYELRYDDCLESFDPGLSREQRLRMGPQFAIYDKHAALLGRKFQVLGLVLLAGNLQLPRLSGDVQAVARRAIRQYEEMASAKQYSMAIRVWIITRGSLYSPDTLALGMIGTAADDDSANGDSAIVSKYRGRIGSAKVDPFDSLRQRFDPRDEHEKLVKLRYFSDTSEDDLRAILNAVTPQ